MCSTWSSRVFNWSSRVFNLASRTIGSLFRILPFRGSVAVAAEAVPNTAAGRGAAVFQAVPAVSEDQSEGRIPPRTSSGKIWQCLGSVWHCLAYAVLVGGSNGDGAWRGLVTIVELIDSRPYIFQSAVYSRLIYTVMSDRLLTQANPDPRLPPQPELRRQYGIPTQF
jgi:hypothetical protein